MSQRPCTPRRAAAFAMGGLFCLLGCLNPRPEELPSAHEDVLVPAGPADPAPPTDHGVSDPGAPGNTSGPSPSVPTDVPAADSGAGDAGGDAGADAGSGAIRADDGGGTCQGAGG